MNGESLVGVPQERLVVSRLGSFLGYNLKFWIQERSNMYISFSPEGPWESMFHRKVQTDKLVNKF